METFQWPKGTQAELKVYPKDHTQRKPTEKYFEDEVRKNIYQVRNNEYTNLWLLIDSLKNLEDQNVRSGFHTWLWAIVCVLGDETCCDLGKRVCQEESFTIEEGNILMEKYRRQEALKYGLAETASWKEINKVSGKRRQKYMGTLEVF